MSFLNCPGLSGFKEKSDALDPNFFSKILSLITTELPKKISQIGPAVPEEIGYKQTRKPSSLVGVEIIFNPLSNFIKNFVEKTL